jgi:hypothetical protein
MGTYKVSWTEEQWLQVAIYADNKELALELFWDKEHNNGQQYGGEIQDFITIERLETED